MESQMAQFAARMWLETDAAFGVREVPLVLPKRRYAVVNAVPASATLTRPALRTAPVVTHARPVAAVRPAAPPANTKETTALGHSVDIPRSVKIPPLPDGRIDALEPISDAEKPRLLAELEQQAIAALSRYLSAVATTVVFGEGDPAAALMFVGEGPGAEEDKTGKPFVGRSGKLLDKMISAMGLSRREVYI
ncbi:MAG: uracil-DNA glycosylase, partial [Phycisphaerae bacterium]